MGSFSDLRTVEWSDGKVRLIDQRLLPNHFRYLTLNDHRQLARAIREMAVRGAPAIGVAAAMGMALAAKASKAKDKTKLMRTLSSAANLLRSSRPTAWNLFWAVDRMLRKAESLLDDSGNIDKIVSHLIEEAKRIAEEDIEANKRIGEFGSRLIEDGDVLLTHCNTGTLATVSYGTALAPVRTAVRQGKKVKIFATETRPRLQGAKLTTYELLRDRIPVTLIVDSAAGYILERKIARKVIVGADRITRSFVANKIGTYPIALAAKANKLPFYVAAPTSTLNLTSKSLEVEIEVRNPQEVTHIDGRRIAPKGVEVFNPAFDLTPLDLVTGVITEKGVFTPDRLLQAA